MKKIFFLSLIILSSLTLSACVKKDNNSTTNIPSASNSQTTETKKSKFSLKDLLSQGIAQKCTWSETTEDGTMTGEILISGKKFKQTSKIPNPMGETQYNMISDGEWFYTWSNDSTTGNMAIKMKMSEVEKDTDIDTTVDAPVTQGSTSVDLDKEVDYKCQPATLSDQDLALPSGIEFIDVNDFINQMKVPKI